MRTCALDDCDLKHHGRGYCAEHYRAYRRGELDTVPAPTPAPELDVQACPECGGTEAHTASCSHHVVVPVSPGAGIEAAVTKISAWALNVPDDTGAAIYSAAMLDVLSRYIARLIERPGTRPADVSALAARCATFTAQISKLDLVTPTDDDGDDPFASFVAELELAVNN